MSLLRATSVLALALAIGAVGTHAFTLAELRAFFAGFFAWVSTPGLGVTFVGVFCSDFLASRRAARAAAASPKASR